MNQQRERRLANEAAITREIARKYVTYDPKTGDLVRLRGRLKGLPAGNVQSAGYIQVSIADRKFLAGRVAWLMHYGRWPRGMLRYRDGVPFNNRITNLYETERNVPQKLDVYQGPVRNPPRRTAPQFHPEDVYT